MPELTHEELMYENKQLKLRIKELEVQVTNLRHRVNNINPNYVAIINSLLEGPKAVYELADLLRTETTMVSHYLYQLKSRHGAKIGINSDKKRFLENPEAMRVKFSTPDEMEENN